MKLACQDGLEQIIQTMKVHFPDVWKMSYPRRIIPPNGYTNPYYYAGSTVCGLLMGSKMIRKGDTGGHSTHILLASKLVERQVPTYFIMPEYLEAVMATDPPGDMTLENIHWPMPAMLFCLPDGFTMKYCGLNSPFISVAHVMMGDHPMTEEGRKVFKAINLNMAICLENEKFLMHYPVFIDDKPPVDYTGTYAVKRPISEMYDTTLEVVTASKDEEVEEKVRKQEAQWNRAMNRLGIKLLLAVTARPQLIEVGAQARPERIKRGFVVKEALWHPNVIGRGYRIKRDPDYQPIGTHASPVMHWRKGHWRTQKYGPGWSKLKVIWIEPMLVNAPKTEGEK